MKKNIIGLLVVILISNQIQAAQLIDPKKRCEDDRLYSLDPREDLSYLRSCLNAGSDPNKMIVLGRTVLSQAACQDFEEIVKLFLDKKADPNYFHGVKGQAPLHCTTFSGAKRSFELLLQRPDIDVNLEDGTGCNPLEIAIRNYRTKMAVRLVEDPRTKVDLKHLELAKNYVRGRWWPNLTLIQAIESRLSKDSERAS